MDLTKFIEEKTFELEWKSRVPSNLVEDQEFLRPKYEPQHPLELETKKFIKDKEKIKEGYIFMMIHEDALRLADIKPHETTYFVKWNFCNVATIQMNKIVFETLKSSFRRYVELSEKEFKDGVRFQGEVRSYYKSYEPVMGDNGEIRYEKVKKDTPKEYIFHAVSFMKKQAILVIEHEFDLRFKNFKNCCDVESESWIYQLEEAREYKKNLESKTPFLDILCMTRGMPKEVLVKRVLDHHDKYLLDYASLLGKYHAIRSQFKNCDNMWDMNILYEDYLNIGMPIKQAEMLGRIDADGNRLNGDLAYGTFGF